MFILFSLYSQNQNLFLRLFESFFWNTTLPINTKDTKELLMLIMDWENREPKTEIIWYFKKYETSNTKQTKYAQRNPFSTNYSLNFKKSSKIIKKDVMAFQCGEHTGNSKLEAHYSHTIRNLKKLSFTIVQF